MHDSAPRIDPVLNLARNQMEQIPNIHRVHLAIVSGKDETKVLEFDADENDRMLEYAIPSLVAEINALGVILTSPAPSEESYGAVVVLIDRTLEAFYVPILRLTNADVLIGDFRVTTVRHAQRYGRIHDELSANWLNRRDG